MYIYHPNTKMTHKNDGFIENLMKMPAPLFKHYFRHASLYNEHVYQFSAKLR